MEGIRGDRARRIAEKDKRMLLQEEYPTQQSKKGKKLTAIGLPKQSPTLVLTDPNAA